MKKKAAARTNAEARWTKLGRREKTFAPQRGQITRSPSRIMGATNRASQSGQARYSGDLAISIDERTVKHLKTDATRHFRADRSSPPSLYLKQRFSFLNIVIFESMKVRT